MSKPLAGVRVLEVAAWTFVPAAGAILSDLGAEVIKVEPPTGDPQRGLKNMLNFETAGPNPFNEIPNRGKRSITVDLANPAGRELVLKIAASSDVFLTSYLPSVRAKLGLDLADVRAANPNIIYAVGHGWGANGPMRNTGGYDLAAGWATSGFASRLAQTSPDGAPPAQPPAFYDLQGGNTLAGAISTALFQRERTGEATTVDVSLMNVGMWSMCPDLVSAPYLNGITVPNREEPGSPLTNWYKTGDGRWIYFVLLQADRFWGEFCGVLQRPDLVDDPRFNNMQVRFQNRRECVQLLDSIFAEHTLEVWKQRLEGFSGVWAPVIDVKEVHQHPQIEPNGYLPLVTGNDGLEFRLVSAPMQFGGEPTVPQGPAPELGQDTEMVLMDAGLDWDQISAARESGALG
ncbi:MAG: CoA transferase [Actinomycetota bacterium]|nr:CoA transferase [Actinomycetota bacterium]